MRQKFMLGIRRSDFEAFVSRKIQPYSAHVKKLLFYQ